MDMIDIMAAKALCGEGGGGGFTPTDAQLTAMNSGIDSTKVEQIGTNTTNILSVQTKTNRIIMDSTESTNIYVQATQPTGEIPEGSIWFNTGVVNP